MSEALNPCPFCNSNEHLAIEAVGSLLPDMPSRPYRVVCTHIDHDTVTGPTTYGRAAAVNTWNHRPAADRIEYLERELETWAKLSSDNDDCRQMWQQRAEAAERKVAELEADQKEARGWARSWHQVCQTIATILDLPEPEGETFAQAVSDKWRDYVPADHYASANHARNAAEADKARLSEALRTLLDCPDIADNDDKDEETHAAERVARAALAGSGSGWPVPDGWKLVPVELTNEMKERVRSKGGPQALAFAIAAWPDLLSAAPQQGGE